MGCPDAIHYLAMCVFTLFVAFSFFCGMPCCPFVNPMWDALMPFCGMPCCIVLFGPAFFCPFVFFSFCGVPCYPLDASGADPKGVLVACLRDGIIEKLRLLPIMDNQYTWPKTIIIALDHYCQFLMRKCIQTRPRQHHFQPSSLSGLVGALGP